MLAEAELLLAPGLVRCSTRSSRDDSVLPPLACVQNNHENFACTTRSDVIWLWQGHIIYVFHLLLFYAYLSEILKIQPLYSKAVISNVLHRKQGVYELPRWVCLSIPHISIIWGGL